MTENPKLDSAEVMAMTRWLLQSTHVLLFAMDGDGRFRLANAAWPAATGWHESDLIGRPALDIIRVDGVHTFEGLVTAATQAGGESRLQVLTKDGAWRWFDWLAERRPDGGLVGSMKDASEGLSREAELEDARRNQRELSRAAGIGLWRYELQAGEIIWSDEFLEATGYASHEISTVADLRARLHPTERRKVRDTFAAALADGELHTLEHRFRSTDGRWTTWRCTLRVETSSNGGTALAGLWQNITELAEAREQARANAHRLNLALEAAEAGVYEIDHVKQTFWASPEFKKVVGGASSSFRDALKLRFPHFHPDDIGRVREGFRAGRTDRDSSSRVFETRIIKPDGEERWVRVFHHLQLGRGGKALKGVGLVLDFDARKRQELALIEAERAAQAAGEAKAAFLANMSHEIRTPMNGVMGVLHLLKGEKLSGDGRDMLDEALSCGHMLAELLNDVIDFSKIEAGHLELSNEPMDPRAVAHGVVRLLGPQAKAKGLMLTAEDVGDIGWVRSDPVRLRQALFNLVGNAVKFTLHGAVTLRSALVDGPGGPMLRFEVEDTGVGIPTDVQPRIFQRFDQGDASTTRRFGGSGLGLSITKRLAQMMGGDVGFRSVPGQGSTFWLEVAAEPATALMTVDDAPDSLLDGLSILVVEDNATNRMIATKLLENLGADVETAADGLLGVEAATRGAFDLILMDIQMPGIDGPEATRRIRQLDSPVARTPIIALTANVLAHQRQAYLAAGMDGVVGKPISPASLLAEIARLSAMTPGVEAAA